MFIITPSLASCQVRV